MLPALAFNDAKAAIVNSMQLVADYYAAVAPKMNDFFKLSNAEFRAKACTLKIGDLVVHTSSHTGRCLERIDANTCSLVIPIEGYNKNECSGAEHTAYGGSSALFLISNKRRSTSEGSSITIRLDVRTLAETFGFMFPNNKKTVSLENSRTLPTEVRDFSFLTHFRLLLNQIDYVNGDLKALEKLAFDDRVYRLSAGLIYPALLLSDESISGRCPKVSSELHMLCEYLRANLKQPVSLTQMERMSGLSARKLQYAFRKEFGMSAREWLRKQRLHAARDALLDAGKNNTIAFVAQDFCFASPLDFSRRYQLEFGERPEQTLGAGRF